MIFSSSGKWLHPLFQLEDFLREGSIDPSMLSLHDSISGIAAASLTIRLGIRKVHADLISEGALGLYRAYGCEIHSDRITDRIKCITESMISLSDDLEESYRKLRKKADLTEGMRVDVQDLVFSYGGKRIIDDISFVLEKGDAVVLRGENGSGKTTLLRLLLGLISPDSGTILYDGEKTLRDAAFIKQKTEAEPFPLSVEEAVRLSMKRGEDNAELAMRKTGCYELRKRNYFTLSGGEAAKVNLARALAAKAKLLLLDEPDAALDRDSRKSFAQLLRNLSSASMPTIILVSHFPEIEKELGWPVLTLEGGRLA